MHFEIENTMSFLSLQCHVFASRYNETLRKAIVFLLYIFTCIYIYIYIKHIFYNKFNIYYCVAALRVSHV